MDSRQTLKLNAHRALSDTLETFKSTWTPLCLVALVTDTHTIGSAVAALASDTNDAALAAKVNFSRSDLSRGREAQVITRCENIHAAATENLDALDDEYGVTQAKLTAL